MSMKARRACRAGRSTTRGVLVGCSAGPPWRRHELQFRRRPRRVLEVGGPADPQIRPRGERLAAGAGQQCGHPTLAAGRLGQTRLHAVAVISACRVGSQPTRHHMFRCDERVGQGPTLQMRWVPCLRLVSMFSTYRSKTWLRGVAMAPSHQFSMAGVVGWVLDRRIQRIKDWVAASRPKALAMALRWSQDHRQAALDDATWN